MTASLWSPGTVIPDVDEDILNISEFFTATAGQTLFTFSDIVYVPGSNTLKVYKNGTELTLGTQYSETSSTSITLTTGAVVGDRIAAILLLAYAVEDTSPASYAADAKAAADAAIAALAIIAGTIDVQHLIDQTYTLWKEDAATSTGNNINIISEPVDFDLTLDTNPRISILRTDGPNTGNTYLAIPELSYTAIKTVTPTGSIGNLSAGQMVPGGQYDLVLYGYTSVAPAPYWLLLNPSPTLGDVPPEIHTLRQSILGVY